MDIDKIHAQVLRPEVRVRTAKDGGSGTVIWSAPDPLDLRHHSTFVLTCWHVIEDALTVRNEWDSRLGRERKQEFRQLVSVEFFDYDAVPHGRRPVSSTVDAEVVAYDKAHDMAILKLRMINVAPYVAALVPLADTELLRIGSPTVTVGCAMGHDPIVTEGHITHMGDEIDFKLYWMSSALSLFGNSGGACFAENDDGDYRMVGIPSRIDVIGWNSPITHLGYISPISRIREFLDEQGYGFLDPDSGKTEESCAEERAEREDQEKRRMIVEGARG